MTRNIFFGGVRTLRIIGLCGAIVIVSLALLGCAARQKNVTNLPAGMTQQQAQSWDTAVANLNKIAATTSTLRQAVIDVRNAGGFPNNTAYAATLQSLAKIDLLQVAAAGVLQQSPQDFSAGAKSQVASYVQQIAAALQGLNTADVSSIKDASSLTTINNLIGEISAAVGLILAL